MDEMRGKAVLTFRRGLPAGDRPAGRLGHREAPRPAAPPESPRQAPFESTNQHPTRSCRLLDAEIGEDEVPSGGGVGGGMEGEGGTRWVLSGGRPEAAGRAGLRLVEKNSQLTLTSTDTTERDASMLLLLRPRPAPSHRWSSWLVVLQSVVLVLKASTTSTGRGRGLEPPSTMADRPERSSDAGSCCGPALILASDRIGRPRRIGTSREWATAGRLTTSRVPGGGRLGIRRTARGGARGVGAAGRTVLVTVTSPGGQVQCVTEVGGPSARPALTRSLSESWSARRLTRRPWPARPGAGPPIGASRVHVRGEPGLQGSGWPTPGDRPPGRRRGRLRPRDRRLPGAGPFLVFAHQRSNARYEASVPASTARRLLWITGAGRR